MTLSYAGFWRRFAAYGVDTFVLLPVMSVGLTLMVSRTGYLLLTLPTFLLTSSYPVYFHARWGQTLGKMATGIRVVTLDGEAISWARAVIRYSPYLLFGLVGAIGSMLAVSAIPPAEFASLGWLGLSRQIDAHMAPALAWGPTAVMVWAFTELVVMLLNARRRTLHDFMAGTVVIDLRRPTRMAADAESGFTGAPDKSAGLLDLLGGRDETE